MTDGTIPRTLPDRRQRPTPALSRYWLNGRRRGGRRSHERERVYVDRYTRGEWSLVLALVALSLVDLVLTQQHLRAGGAEWNPLMAWALEAGGDVLFSVLKLGLTLAGAAVLLVHVRFPLARRFLPAGVALYGAVLLWHAVVIAHRSAVG